MSTWDQVRKRKKLEEEYENQQKKKMIEAISFEKSLVNQKEKEKSAFAWICDHCGLENHFFETSCSECREKCLDPSISRSNSLTKNFLRSLKLILTKGGEGNFINLKIEEECPMNFAGANGEDRIFWNVNIEESRWTSEIDRTMEELEFGKDKDTKFPYTKWVIIKDEEDFFEIIKSGFHILYNILKYSPNSEIESDVHFK